MQRLTLTAGLLMGLAGCSSTPLGHSPVLADGKSATQSSTPSPAQWLGGLALPPGSFIRADQSLIIGAGDNWVGRAVLDGLARAGVVGTIKHMPGHGRSLVDTHKELPTVTASEAELESDIAPFKALADAPIAMTGHLIFTAWDADHPATQSPYVIEQVIRQKIGFDGLLLTDDLDMEALSGTVPERAETAIRAGCDIALNCWGKMPDMIGICERLGTMAAATAKRHASALDAIQAPRPTAAQAELAAKRDALLALVEKAEARA